jgi:hypothetical protein
MSNITTQNTTTDYIAMMMKREKTVAKMVANMKAKGIEQALKDAAKEQKEVEETSPLYDFKNFDSKSFAAWAKSSSTPIENTNGRLKTF